VIDAEDKAEKPGGFPDAGLHQMLAHCTALRLPLGHLGYAKGNEAGRSTGWPVRPPVSLHAVGVTSVADGLHQNAEVLFVDAVQDTPLTHDRGAGHTVQGRIAFLADAVGVGRERAYEEFRHPMVTSSGTDSARDCRAARVGSTSYRWVTAVRGRCAGPPDRESQPALERRAGDRSGRARVHGGEDLDAFSESIEFAGGDNVGHVFAVGYDRHHLSTFGALDSVLPGRRLAACRQELVG